MRLRDVHYRAAAIVIGLLLLGIVGLNVWFWERLSTANRVTMVASSLGAMGTLVLAAATLISIRQQAETVDDIYREREKPLAIDEISQIIDPALEALENNRGEVHSQERFPWDRIEEPGVAYGMLTVHQVIPEGADYTVMSRFQREAPELYQMMEEYEDWIAELGEIASDAKRKSERAVEKYVEEHDVTNEDGDRPDVEELASAAFPRTSGFEGSEEVWNEHGEQLRRVAREHVKRDLTRIEDKEIALEELATTLERDLEERKHELRQQYGISNRELRDATVDPSDLFS